MGASSVKVDGDRVELGDIEFRPDEQLLIGVATVALTRQEGALLRVLCQNVGHVVSKARLYDLAWPTGSRLSTQDRSVDVYIHKLRVKLGRAAPAWTFIHTHHGLGYRFDPERRS